LQLCLCF